MRTVDIALGEIRTLLGARGWIEDPAVLEPRLLDARKAIRGTCVGLARPSSTQETSEVLRLCNDAGIPIVPQGGNTGRSAGSIPDADGRAILLSVDRMDEIRAIDRSGFSVVVEAGCILRTLKDAVLEQGRLFPLSLGAEGSCQIGGNVATNAGGIAALKYGNMRDLVLGLEVVLPDGQVWHGLNKLRKNNTGYDLKHLFIGSEGTLGVVTAASLKLFPAPKAQATALCNVSSADRAIEFLSLVQEMCSGSLSAFEIMSEMSVRLAIQNVMNTRYPLSTIPPWSLLVELEGFENPEPLEHELATCLETAFERGLIDDGTIAASGMQRQAMWHLREALVEGAMAESKTLTCDIAVPVSRVPAFLDSAMRAVAATCPGCRPYPFGHLGDGNIHFNTCAPVGEDLSAFNAASEEIKSVVEDIAVELGGTHSAEHGVGITKLRGQQRYKSKLEIELMRAVKTALDPAGLMNPGKLLPPIH